MTAKDYFSHDEFARRAGIELLEARPGYARARMEITPGHLNAGGVCQGGAIFTLADFLFGVASNAGGRLTFSINASMNYFRSEREGTLTAEAREVFDHRRLSHCEVEVRNAAGDLVATYSGTGFRKDAPPIPIEAE